MPCRGSAIAIAAYVVGEVFGRRTKQADRAETARAAAEAHREAEAREAVARERARIAREIHDVIAHGLGAIVVQSGAARLDAPDPRTAERLQVVERLLAPVAAGAPAPARHPPPRGRRRAAGPQPGVAGLGELAESARASGLDVRLDVDGVREGLAPGVEPCAYRLVQEALTNVARHARATRCGQRVTCAGRTASW